MENLMKIIGKLKIGQNMTGVKRIYKKDDTYDVVISWTIHNSCNYSCTYCPPSLHRGDLGWLDYDKAIEFVDVISKRYVEEMAQSRILFSFSGGEPTLWKGFHGLCKYIGEKGFRIAVTTNGSSATGYWDEIAEYFDVLIFSYHSEWADPDTFVKNYKKVADKPNCVMACARVMMHDDPENWINGEYVVHQIKNQCRDYKIQAVGLVDGYDEKPIPRNYPYPEQVDFLKENAFIEKKSGLKNPNLPKYYFRNIVEYENGQEEFVDENKLLNEGLCNFDGWSCNIGLEQLYINDHGEVYGASCRLGGSYGSILEPNQIKFPNKPVICSFKLCHCASDIRVSKQSLD